MPWLAWERLSVVLEELVEEAGGREVWASLLGLLSPRPYSDKVEDDGWMDGCLLSMG